jgi:hypothetical protein
LRVVDAAAIQERSGWGSGDGWLRFLPKLLIPAGTVTDSMKLGTDRL